MAESRKAPEDAREVLLQHLDTTLKMDWDKPTPMLQKLLDAIDQMGFVEEENQEIYHNR